MKNESADMSKLASPETRASRVVLALALGCAGFAVTATALNLAGYTTAAVAQVLKGHDSSAPVSVAADRTELQSRVDRVVIAGNVIITQAGLTLNAGRVTIAYSDASGIDINRIDAVGGVVVRKGGETARGNVAIYDLNRSIITMAGNVELTQVGGNRLSGGRLVIDLNSGRATVDGRGNAGPAITNPDGSVMPDTGTGNTGGRVTGTFSVKKKN
jgi:lipopolysaccharide export system protein LptA